MHVHAEYDPYQFLTLFGIGTFPLCIGLAFSLLQGDKFVLFLPFRFITFISLLKVEAAPTTSWSSCAVAVRSSARVAASSSASACCSGGMTLRGGRYSCCTARGISATCRCVCVDLLQQFNLVLSILDALGDSLQFFLRSPLDTQRHRGCSVGVTLLNTRSVVHIYMYKHTRPIVCTKKKIKKVLPISQCVST